MISIRRKAIEYAVCGMVGIIIICLLIPGNPKTPHTTLVVCDVGLVAAFLIVNLVRGMDVLESK